MNSAHVLQVHTTFLNISQHLRIIECILCVLQVHTTFMNLSQTACAVIGEGVAETHSSFNVKAEKAIAR